MNDDLERLKVERAECNARLAAAVVSRLARMSAGEAEAVIARLLMQAYEHGRLDMYVQIDEQLKPLWKVAGLE